MRNSWIAWLVIAVLLATSGAFAAPGLPAKPARLTMAVVAGGETKGLKAILPMWEKEKGVKVFEVLEGDKLRGEKTQT